MRDTITTLLEVAGFAFIGVAAFQVNLGVGLLVVGCELIALGYLLGRVGR